ncbi:telomere repeats-binding bouquet formation protein 1-like isoform X2 [Dysidea avara]|uniref:telomere repeats-binding bouquet formation protein 1-like isoform X2 n=1 Tax=Dysidea avara TaxID=196820 RepID=UPI00331F47D4
MSVELQEDLQLLLDSLKYRNDDVEQQKQALQTIATMCSEHTNINEHFCDDGGLDLVVELVRADGVVDNVRQAALYCISIAIESNVGAQMKLCNKEMFDFLHQLLQCEAASNGVKATAVYLVNSLVHNNGTGQNLCRDSKVLLRLIKMFKMYITPLLGTDGASAGNSVTARVTAPDGLELWISVCNTLGSACNNPQNEINQTRCSQLFAGAVSLLRPPVQHEMVRPAVSLLNYCSSGHYVNKERIRLVGGLRAMLMLLKELSCSASDLEQAVHLVRLLTTCATDNGANQKVANQLDVIPVLLELLRNDPLDNNQKLCIVMCLAVLTDGNVQLQQQLADNNGFSLLVQLMASSKNDELCRAVTYVLHSCLKEKNDDVDPIGDDIERLDAILNSSNEISRRYSPVQQDDQANNTCFTGEHVSAEDRKDQVEQWLDGINTEVPEADILSPRETELCQQTTTSTTNFTSLVPLLKLLFTDGIPDGVKCHLPDSLQSELDRFVHQYTQPPSSKVTACNEPNSETFTQQKDDASKQVHNNSTVTKEVKKKEWVRQDIVATKEEQEIPLNSKKSEVVDNAHDESKSVDKWEAVTDDSLLHYGIDSPLVCKDQSGDGKQGTKNLPRNSKQLKPITTSAETSEDVIKSHSRVLKPVSSKNIRYATPCLHHGPKKLLNQTLYCLGCKPRPFGIILTSRNYSMYLKSDEHTCAYHRGLVNTLYETQLHSECEQVDKAITEGENVSTHDHSTDVLPKDRNEIQSTNDEPVLSSDMLSPVKPTESIAVNISNDCEGIYPSHKPHVQVLQDTTNSNALKVFEYHTPVIHDTRPTQLVQAKAFKASRSRVIFTPIEEQYIIEGVQKLGKRWRHILNAYPFHPSRTQVNIKDKYRQLCTSILDSKQTTETG